MENMQVIASEKPDFDRDEFLEFLETHGGGYFLRDPDSVYDCQYFDPDIFPELYSFASPPRGELFRYVHKL